MFSSDRQRSLYAAVLFCLLGALLAVALDAVLRAGARRVRFGDIGVWNAVVSGALGSDVLVVGSSRAQVDVDCEALRNGLGLPCYNLNVNGVPTQFQRVMLATYLAHNRPPRVAVVVADISGLYMPDRIMALPGYAVHLDDETIYEGFKPLKPDLWKDRYLPLVAFADAGLALTAAALKGALGRDDPRAHSRFGYIPVDWSWDGSFDTFVAQNPNGAWFPVDPRGVQSFDDMLSMLARQKVCTVVSWNPEWVGVLPYERNRDEIVALYRATARAHGATFIDYKAQPITQDRSNFYNSQHLNRSGATKFSRILARDLIGVPCVGSRLPDRPVDQRP